MGFQKRILGETRGASVAVAGGGTRYETIAHLAKTHDVVLLGVSASTTEEAVEELKRSGMPEIEIGSVSALFVKLDSYRGEYDVHCRYVHMGLNPSERLSFSAPRLTPESSQEKRPSKGLSRPR